MDKFEVDLTRTEAQARDFVGLTVEDARLLAQQRGLAFRTFSDKNADLTADWHPRRMTVKVNDGAVTEAFAG